MLKGELFSTDMVRAYLEKRKVHTARPLKIEFLSGFSPEWSGYQPVYERGEFFLEGSNHCDATKNVNPKYQPGDYMYCRETWCRVSDVPAYEEYRYSNGNAVPADEFCYKAGSENPDPAIRWHPSIHMPSSAARLFFRVTKVEVMRLEDVTEEFAIDDGFIADGAGHASRYFRRFWVQTYGPSVRWMWVYWTEPCTKEEALSDGK